MKPNWSLFDSAEAVALAAVEQITLCANEAIEGNNSFHIALAGGTTPKRCYEILSQTQQDWAKWHIYIGDERCLPEDDTERNSIMIQKTLLDKVAIPAQQFFPIKAELGNEAAAKHYSETLPDKLDFVLLGMGEDGHTASLFPRHKFSTSSKAQAIYKAPKPPPKRVSLSYDYIEQAKKRLVLVTGASKQPALSSWLKGDPLPVARVENNSPTLVYLEKIYF